MYTSIWLEMPVFKPIGSSLQCLHFGDCTYTYTMLFFTEKGKEPFHLTLFNIDEEQKPDKNNTDPMKYISVKYIC